MVFLPQSPRRFTQSSPRVFRCTSSLCSLCLLRVLCGSLFFYHKAHGGLHKVNRGFFEVLIFCALCVFFVYSVVPYFFHHKAHGGSTKLTEGFSRYLFFVPSVSSSCTLWFLIFFTTKPTEVYTKFTKAFRCSYFLYSLCLLCALCG
jgi:cytochrome bd-type quinol oxidase subunit 2